jgi:phosphomannomutase/phosphoglucomutase
MKVKMINGFTIEFYDGWGLIRASNTQSVLVTRFEALTKEASLKEHDGKIWIRGGDR